LLIVFDGWDYLRLIPLPTILDNLIASQKIMPLVAILIHNESQVTRNRELGCDAIFTDFLAKELVPSLIAARNIALDLDSVQSRSVSGNSGKKFVQVTRNLLPALLISLLDRLPGDALNLHAINPSISKLHFHKCREERGSVRSAILRDAIAI
jgi:hypothetical protein